MEVLSALGQRSFRKGIRIGTSGTKTIGLHIALTRITKSEHVHIQQLLVRYLHQQRIAGNGEDHAV